jgi:hypothetical protein
MNAAMAFAGARQFGEGERLADEAIAIGQNLHPPRTDVFQRQAQQIRSGGGTPQTVITGSRVGILLHRGQPRLSDVAQQLKPGKARLYSQSLSGL